MNEENIKARKYAVGLWFQVVVCVGILAVSVASAAYAWRTWRVFDLERRADEICKYYIEQRMPGYVDRDDAKTAEDVLKVLEAWVARRECINRVMGHSFSESREAN